MFYLSVGGKTSDVLRTVTLNIVGNNICKTYYEKKKKERGGLKNGLLDEQLCAGNIAGGFDTCQVI